MLKVAQILLAMLPLLFLQFLHDCVRTAVCTACFIHAVDQSPTQEPMPMPAPYARGCRAGLKAGNKQKTRLHKKHVVKKHKKKVKADLIDDAADAVLQGQQQVLGDLSQAMLHWSDMDAMLLHSS